MLFSTLLSLLFYTLVPGDAVVIRSTNYRELNDTLIVLADTTAELPYIGRTNVSEITEENLREFFVETYQRYLKEPDIAVFVLYRVSIIGRVSKPGIYYLPPYAGLGDVLAISGGPLPDAALGSIRIYSAKTHQRISFRKGMKDDISIKDLNITSGTVVEVPRKFVVSLEDIYKFAATTGILWSVYRDVINR